MASEARYRIARGPSELLEFRGKPGCDDPNEEWRRIDPGE
jgi:hypothetical protein